MESNVDSWLAAASLATSRGESWPSTEVRDQTAIGMGSLAIAVRAYADARRRWGPDVASRVLLTDVEDTVDIEAGGDWNAYTGRWTPELLEQMAHRLRSYASPGLPPLRALLPAGVRGAALKVANWLDSSAKAV